MCDNGGMTGAKRPARAPTGETLLGLLERKAANSPRETACCFYKYGDGRCEATAWSWARLRESAVAAAAAATDARGRPILLIYSRWEQFLPAYFGCLYAGGIATPLPASHPALLLRAAPRFEAVARDCRPAAIWTSASLAPTLSEWANSRVPAIAVRATDAPDPSAPPVSRRGLGRRADPAVLQYTSGSTRSPRGVLVSQRNLFANFADLRRFLGSAPGRRLVTWLPHYHDMGLVSALHALAEGMPVHAINPVDFLKEPSRWLRLISDSPVPVISGAPDFAYALCADGISEAEAARLDLSRWVTAWNSSEEVRSETLESFARRFEGRGFRREALKPCYGLAEATLIVAGAPPSGRAAFGARTLVGVGRPFARGRVVVVSPRTRRELGEGRLGEIWVRGPSVAEGYWGRPAQSRHAFGARTADGRGPFLRTRDLGFFQEGELFVAGRLDDVIVLRGRKIHPEDLERAAESAHPDIRRGACAAVAVRGHGGARAAMAVELRTRVPLRAADEIAVAVRRAVFEACGVELAGVRVLGRGRLPRTTSGKIRRRACAAFFASAEGPEAAR